MLPFLTKDKNKKTKINVELIDEMYRNYYRLLLYEASKILFNKSNIEDLVHDAIEKIIKNIDSIDGGNIHSPKFKNTAVVILKNVCYDEFRRQKRANDKFIDIGDEEFDIPDSGVGVEELIISAETIGLISKAIDSLDFKYSSVLQLRYFSDMSFEEISLILEITPENARKRFQRAKKLLMEHCVKGGIIIGK